MRVENGNRIRDSSKQLTLLIASIIYLISAANGMLVHGDTPSTWIIVEIIFLLWGVLIVLLALAYDYIINYSETMQIIFYVNLILRFLFYIDFLIVFVILIMQSMFPLVQGIFVIVLIFLDGALYIWVTFTALHLWTLPQLFFYYPCHSNKTFGHFLDISTS